MAKFILHKKGFFYTDEAFEVAEGIKGSILNVYATPDEARVAREEADIESMRGLAGMNAVDFIFYSDNYDERYQQLAAFYEKEYGLTIADKYYFNFPDDINPAQAKVFLGIIGTSFHDILEYPDDAEPDSDEFALDEDFGEF